MKTSNLVKVASQSIVKNKMRTLLTMLGIIIGVGAVIVMVAVGMGARSQIREQINNLGTNMLVVSPGFSMAGGVNQGAGSFNRLTLADAEKIEREASLINAVSPVITTRVQAIANGNNWRAMINGVSTGYQVIRDWEAESGAWFSDVDVRTNRKVALLGKTVADALYPDMDPVGQRIQLRGVPFDVVGVLTVKGQTANGSDQDDTVLIPYTTANTRLAGRNFIPQILVSTSSPADIPAATIEIRDILRESHGLGFADEDDFTVRNQNELAEAAEGTTEVMTLLLAAIASISLLVGGIGIMNIMLVSVTERTREIGIRMAIGARGKDVLTQFLVESIVMSLMGGVVGLGVGVGGAAILGSVTGWNTEISVFTVIVAVGFSAAVGVFFGFYPARKAAALNPIDALRYE
jgi:putative ABC transport system permease protein